MTTAQTIVASIAAVAGIAGFAAAVYVFARVHGMEATITLLDTANEALRKTNADGDLKRLQMRDELQARLHIQELECQRQISELQGQVNALTGGLARDLIGAVVDALKTTTTTTTTTATPATTPGDLTP